MSGIRAKVAPGPWSVAAATYFSQALPVRGGTRQSTAQAAGMSLSKLGRLLDGQQSWYLEDVHQIASAMGSNADDVLVAIMELAAEQSKVATVTPIKRMKKASSDHAGKMQRVARPGKTQDTDED